MRVFTGIVMGIFLAACAATPPLPGDTEASVIAKLGQPAGRYQQNGEISLEYPTGPFGQRTFFAYFGSNGKLRSYEQVLTTQKFALIQPGQAKKDDVLRLVGRPAETSYLSRPDLEVWSYRYKENDVWDSMMHVHFDRNGVVRKLENGPDPMFDRDSRRVFGGRH